VLKKAAEPAPARRRRARPLSRQAGFPFSPKRRPSWIAALGAFCLLAGCADLPYRGTANPDEQRLFTEAYDNIIEYHIEAASADGLTMAGLDKLAALDPAISLERQRNELVVRYFGKPARQLTAPATEAPEKWGHLTAAALAAARELSPTIAAVPADQLDETVIDAALATLDRFSHYARPEIARERRAARDGFGGVGVSLDIRGSEVRIASVLPETPASAAGLLPGDRITALDGVATAQLSALELRRHLRGPAKTTVTLTILRAGTSTPLSFTLERTLIVPSTVTFEAKGDVAWLRLRGFNQQTAQRLSDLLAKAHRDMGSGLRGLVLDLRDNPGGLLSQAVEVASLFLNGGDVVSTIGRNPQAKQHYDVPPGHPTESLPMVVLINGGSASASEIVAAALQDDGRAVVIGTSSFGKGTVQTVIRTSNDGELTITWARLVTPRGYLLHHHGVIPTLCTAELADDAASVARVLRGDPSPVPPELAATRTDLDEAGWHKLRERCQAEHELRSIDTQVARRLLEDPALYRLVLGCFAPARVHGLAARAED